MNNLKTIRVGKKITRSRLAAAAGVTVRHICFLEDGTKNPSLKVANRIAEALGLPIEEIFLAPGCTRGTYKDGGGGQENPAPEGRAASRREEKKAAPPGGAGARGAGGK